MEEKEVCRRLDVIDKFLQVGSHGISLYVCDTFSSRGGEEDVEDAEDSRVGSRQVSPCQSTAWLTSLPLGQPDWSWSPGPAQPDPSLVPTTAA